MLTTAIALLAAVALLVPGFIVAELATTGRARTQGSDLELALRALAYALVVHLAFAWWTVDLARDVGAIDDWPEHSGALWAYAAVVLVTVPAIAGTVLNVYLRFAERRPSPLPLLAAVFGGRDARDAFDYALSRVTAGGWLIIELRDHTADGSPRFVGGTFGRASAAGVSPHAHNLFLQQEWEVDALDGDALPNLVGPIEPTRGLMISAEQITKVHVISPAAAAPPRAARRRRRGG